MIYCVELYLIHLNYIYIVFDFKSSDRNSMKLLIADTKCVSNEVTMNAEPFERKPCLH